VIYFKDGVVDLKKDSVHLLRREEAQPLISEGVLEKLDDT
jgi:GINS complex subunit 1